MRREVIGGTAMLKRTVSGLCVIFVSALLVGCASGTTQDAWTDVVKKCADNQLLGKDVLYFGVSGGYGPGTIFRVKDPKGYGLRVDGEETGVPKANRLHEGSVATCAGTAKHTSSVSPSLDVTTLVPGLTASASADIQRGRDIDVSATKIRWDDLKAKSFEDNLSQDMKNEAKSANRVIVTRALWIIGMKAVVNFSSETAASLKVKYDPAVAAGFSLGAGLTGKWTDETKIEVSAEPTYLAGELGTWGDGGIAAGEAILKPVPAASQGTTVDPGARTKTR
jgi:hypothetical protein